MAPLSQTSFRTTSARLPVDFSVLPADWRSATGVVARAGAVVGADPLAAAVGAAPAAVGAGWLGVAAAVGVAAGPAAGAQAVATMMASSSASAGRLRARRSQRTMAPRPPSRCARFAYCRPDPGHWQAIVRGPRPERGGALVLTAGRGRHTMPSRSGARRGA